MSFWIINLGCKVNRVESDTIASALSFLSKEAASGEAAEVIIVNTCTVTSDAEKKTRKAIRRALAMNLQARVVVTGCAVAIDPQSYLAMNSRIVVEPDKSKVVHAVEKLLGKPAEASKENKANFLRLGESFPTRVGIKIQDGCNNACTYCIVHTARGKAVSKPSTEILEELAAYEKAGIREVVLTGINLGSYFDRGDSLAKLLERFLEANNTMRYRISSIEPKDLDTDLIDLIAKSQGRICRHLHLPLQSGSSKILKAMARPYDAKYFQELVERLYASIPLLSLSTDIIVGFPGETEEDFKASFDLSSTSSFSKIHLFRYSPRKGTPAATMKAQVSPEIKAERARKLAVLAQELRAQDIESRRGKFEMVLVEARDKGMTESYHHISLPKGKYQPGSLVKIRL